MKIVINDGVNIVVFNGIIYLAKNIWFSSQYIGSGKTIEKAIDNMNKTINKFKFKTRDKKYKIYS